MIEKYSNTVKDIVTGLSHQVSSEAKVCDRCGFAKRSDELRRVDDLELCESCMDKERK